MTETKYKIDMENYYDSIIASRVESRVINDLACVVINNKLLGKPASVESEFYYTNNISGHYYVYSHTIEGEFLPFYVGFSRNNDGIYLRSKDFNGRSKHWNNYLSTRSENSKIIVKILGNIETEVAAKELESFYIKHYSNNLVNVSNNPSKHNRLNLKKIKERVIGESMVVKMYLFTLCFIVNNTDNIDNYLKLLKRELSGSKLLFLNIAEIIGDKSIISVKSKNYLEIISIFNYYIGIIAQDLGNIKYDARNMELYEYNEYMYDIICNIDSITPKV